MLTSDRLCIRPVALNERDAILGVYRECEDFLSLGPVATASMEMVQADLDHSKKDEGIFCGIYDRLTHAMIGVLDYVPRGWEGIEDRAFLALLMIAAPYRSRGIGEEVVKMIEEELVREKRVTTIASGVQVNNPKAIRFWQRMGYVIVSEPIDYEDGTTAYRLLKQMDGERSGGHQGCNG